MSYRRAFLLACLAGSAGCLDIPDVSEAGRFKCQDDTHCLVGYQCVNGTCMSADTVADTVPPGPPSQLVATPSDGRIGLAWKNPTDGDFTGVVVRRSATGYPTGPTAGVGVYQGAGTSCVDIGLTNGQMQYYSVFAYDRKPNYSTPAQVTAVPNGAATVSPVTGLAWRLLGRSVLLSWTLPSGAVSAVVRRDTSSYPTLSSGILVSSAAPSSIEDAGTTPGATYYYSVFAQSSTGASSAASQLMVTLPTVVPAVRAGLSWNTWVNASGAPCTAADAGKQGACVHAGERRMFLLTGHSCSERGGLTASDSLAVFDWKCTDTGEGAQFVSTGFKAGKGVFDLLDTSFTTTTPVWRQNQVVILDPSNNWLASSLYEPWWDNVVKRVAAGDNATEAGTVYVWDAATDSDFAVVATNATVVGLAAAVPQKGSTTTGTPVISVSAPFAWIENLVIQVAATGKNGILVSQNPFTVVRNSTIAGNTGGSAIYLYGAQNGRYENLVVTGGTTCVEVQTSSYNAFTYVTAANGDGAGFFLRSSDGNVLRHIRAVDNHYGSGADAGIYVNGSYNVIAGALTSANAQFGVVIDGTSSAAYGNVVTAVTAGNNGLAGLRVAGSYAAGTRVLGFAALNDMVSLEPYADQTWLGDVSASSISIDTASNVTFARMLVVPSTTSCSVSGTTTAGLASPCAVVAPSIATLVTGVDFSAGVAGKVTWDDYANASDSNGLATYSSSLDWTRFDDPLRAYGNDGAAFPSADNRGACSSGSCRIWDWRAQAADGSVLRGIVQAPSASSVVRHIWLYAGQNACAGLAGATWDGSACWSDLVPGSIELDRGGNGNGICESGESCLTTPNVGVYQGHGQLLSAGSFSDGTRTTTFQMYGTNGI